MQYWRAFFISFCALLPSGYICHPTLCTRQNKLCDQTGFPLDLLKWHFSLLLSPLTHPLCTCLPLLCLDRFPPVFLYLHFCTFVTFEKYFCHPLVVEHVSASPVTRLVSSCRSVLMDRSAPLSQRPLRWIRKKYI